MYGEKRITVDSPTPVVENGEAITSYLPIELSIRISSKGCYGESYISYIFVANGIYMRR